MKTDLENIIISIAVIILIALAVYFSSKAKVKLNKDGLELDTKKNPDIKVNKIDKSQIGIKNNDGNNITIEDVKNNSKIDIT